MYAADESIYSRIKKNIKCGVEEIENIQFSETKELGRVNKVDPLGITSLRIRGMWTIEHPFQVFDYIPELQKHNNVNKLYVYALMDDIKYSTFCEEEKNSLISQPNVNIYDKQVKNPNNPVQLINAKLITIEI